MEILDRTIVGTNLRMVDNDFSFDIFSLGLDEISTSTKLEYTTILTELIRPVGDLLNFLTKYRSEDMEYIGPISFKEFQLVFWEKDGNLVFMITEAEREVYWIIQSISYLLEFSGKLSRETILDIRYKFPSVLSVDPKLRNFALEDPFRSIPQTYFKASMIQEGPASKDQSELGEIITIISKNLSALCMGSGNLHELGMIIESLQSPSLNRERFYISLNLLDALVFSGMDKHEISTIIAPHYLNLIEYLDLQGFNNLSWVIKGYLGFYFGVKVDIEPRQIDDYSIPNIYYLLPHLIRVTRETKSIENIEGELSTLLGEIIEFDYPFYGQSFLYESIAYVSAEIKNYRKAMTYFTLAADYYTLERQVEEVEKCLKNSVQSSCMHYVEYATAANLFHFLGQNSEGIKMGWMALNLSMTVVMDSLNISLEYTQDILETILFHIDECKRPLLSEETDMTPVIELKLDELINFYSELLNEKTEDVTNALQSIEMHKESIKFLMPFTPPVFLFLTVDGRLLYSVKATADLEMEELHLSNLMAGVLTAVRSIFVEASFSGGGAVKEINTGDSTLLIEARNNIVVVASSLNMTQEIRSFTLEIADQIDEEFSQLLETWDGGTESVDPIVDMINQKVLSDLVN